MELDLAQLRALAAAVDEGTFDAAASALHVTPSAISQRIKGLEVATGQVLLVRSRPIRPTQAGQAVLQLARQIELLAASAASELRAAPGTPTRVSVAVNADSLATWLLPALRHLSDEVVFDLHREDEVETATLLRDGTVAAAFTAAAEPVPGCVSLPLGIMRYRPAAATEFVARWFPEGPTSAALERAPVVHFDRHDQLQRRWLAGRGAGQADPPCHHVPSSDGFQNAVLAGFGWGMLTESQLAAASEGAVTLLDSDDTVDVPLYWQRWKLRSSTLDRLTDAVRSAAGEALHRHTPDRGSSRRRSTSK
jgi:LysR family transcriptional regulator, chromosome initiation inhibitor